MKTENIKNFAKKIDEMIPDATTETMKVQCTTIGSNAMDTGKCALATMTCVAGTTICAYRTVRESAKLGLMISKTTTKNLFNEVKDFYAEKPAMTVRR